MAENVRFIRKGGKIIPIRSKSKKKSNKLGKVAAVSGLAGVGTGSLAVIKHSQADSAFRSASEFESIARAASGVDLKSEVVARTRSIEFLASGAQSSLKSKKLKKAAIALSAFSIATIAAKKFLDKRRRK